MISFSTSNCTGRLDAHITKHADVKFVELVLVYTWGNTVLFVPLSLENTWTAAERTPLVH